MASKSVEILLHCKDQASGPMAKVGQSTKSLMGHLGGLKTMLIGGLGAGAVVSGMKSILGSFMEAENATAKLGAVLQATGNVSGFTLKQMRDYAGELQNVAAIDDDLIASSMGVLATFKNIRGQAFKDATKAALDMSAVMGTDLQGAIVQVGKALNDPIKGLSALSKVGVSFDASQKATIKTMMATNDILGAQKIILAELNSEFGGAAAAAANTLEGSVNKLSLAFDGLKTSIGGAMAPTLTKWLELAAKAVNEQMGGNDPAIQNRIDQFGKPANLQFPDKKDLGARMRGLNAELASTMKVRDDLLARQKSFWTFSWKNETKIGDADTAIRDILREMKQLNAGARDPAGRANQQVTQFFDRIISEGPKAVGILRNFNERLKESEATVRQGRENAINKLRPGALDILKRNNPMAQPIIDAGQQFGQVLQMRGAGLIDNRQAGQAAGGIGMNLAGEIGKLMQEQNRLLKEQNEMMKRDQQERPREKQVLVVRDGLN